MSQVNCMSLYSYEFKFPGPVERTYWEKSYIKECVLLVVKLLVWCGESHV